MSMAAEKTRRALDKLEERGHVTLDDEEIGRTCIAKTGPNRYDVEEYYYMWSGGTPFIDHEETTKRKDVTHEEVIRLVYDFYLCLERLMSL